MLGRCKNAIRMNRILQLAQVVALIEFGCGDVRLNPKLGFLDGRKARSGEINTGAGLAMSALGGLFAGRKFVIFVSMQSTYVRHSFSVALSVCDQSRNDLL